MVGELVDPRAPGLSITSGAPLATERNVQQDRLRGIEDDLLERSLTTVQDALAFQEIDPEQASPPLAWVEELGPKAAERRLRLAKAAWMSAKDAPVGLKVAKDMAAGIIRARSAEQAAPRLAVAVQVVTSSAQYPSIEVDSG